MGIFDFFKKKKENLDLGLSRELIQFSNIGTWIQTKKSELSDKESEIITQIQNQLNQLTQELEQETEILQNIDLESKPKTEERIKLIVKGNLENYIIYLLQLIKNIKVVEPNIITLTEKINQIFSEFEQKSNLSYQKATLLIGEVEKTKINITNFFKNLKNILNENKNLILLLKTISFTETKLNEINELKNTKTEIQETLKKIQEKQSNKDSEIKLAKELIQELRQSKEYQEELKNKQEIQKQELKIEMQIQNLRKEINFKELANIFHTNKKEMEIIKKHKDDFKDKFNNDNGEKILQLLNEAKLNSDSIETQINNIIQTKKELNKTKESLDETKTKEISNNENKITQLKQEIETEKYEQIREEAKQDRLNKNKEEIKEVIKKELEKISVIVED